VLALFFHVYWSFFASEPSLILTYMMTRTC
jgi:hypothetical protein